VCMQTLPLEVITRWVEYTTSTELHVLRFTSKLLSKTAHFVSVTHNERFELWPKQCMETSLSNAHNEVFLWIKGLYPEYVWNAWMTAAAAQTRGNLWLVKELQEKGCPWSVRTLQGACACGDLSMVKYLVEQNCPKPQGLILTTVQNGHFDILAFLCGFEEDYLAGKLSEMQVLSKLLDLKFLENYELCSLAKISAKIGRRDICEWAFSKFITFGNPAAATNSVISAGNIEILQWCRSHGGNYDGNSFSAGILSGSFEILKFLEEDKCPLPSPLRMSNALSEIPNLATAEYVIKMLNPSKHFLANSLAVIIPFSGNLDVVKLFVNHGASLTNDHACLAARHGQFEILRWIFSRGIPLTKSVCASAAAGGRLDIIKWVRKNGGGWNSKVCHFAAARGHLSVLKYARENGCPWNEEIMCVQSASHLEILVWILQNGITAEILQKVIDDPTVVPPEFPDSDEEKEGEDTEGEEEGEENRSGDDDSADNDNGMGNWDLFYSLKRPYDTLNTGILANGITTVKWLLDHGFKLDLTGMKNFARRIGKKNVSHMIGELIETVKQ
jgi:hypothetical protein